MSEISAGVFADPSRAARNLSTLRDMFVDSGSRCSFEAFSQGLESALLASPDPDTALMQLLRFSEASFSKASLFTDITLYPAYMELLVGLFGSSRYFADILVREPELFRWLTGTDVLEKVIVRSVLESETTRLVLAFPRPERRLDALRRLYRREILRIGAQDVLGLKGLEDITFQISALADALIHAAFQTASVQLASRYPTQPATSFAVIGLGKLGGAELNYSSDIDVMFVYDEEGEVPDAKGIMISHHEYFNALAGKIVTNLAEPTSEGHLYRVDARLRPEGGAGPLARSLRSYLVYYESRGDLWERQMLIKARCVAGDNDLGRRLISQLESFIYPRTFFQHPAQSVARIKARIEATVGDEANIKLRAGGIRDIEFIVQTLQLINGGRNRNVREGNTLLALAALTAEGFLTTAEMEVLSDAYRFYRTLEHRLQIALNTQTHTVPADPASQERIARQMGLASRDALMEKSRRLMSDVRRIFDQVMAVGDTAKDDGIVALIDGSLPDKAISGVLARYGLRDAKTAARSIRSLVTGSSLTEAREIDGRARDTFRGVAPALFEEIAASPIPDHTLHNLAGLLADQKNPGQMYAQLQEQHFRKFLLAICGVSNRFARGLARSPLLLESLASDIGSLSRGLMLELPPTASLAEFKMQQELRIGIRHLLGFTSFEQLTGELSHLADFVLTSVHHQTLRNSRRKRMRFALFALGKLGTHELSFDGDLDLLFVVDASSGQQLSDLERLAARLLQSLTSVAEGGPLYAVDVRLRPEGRNSPLVIDLASYGKYLAERASLWERQSLTRLRHISGDAELGREVVRMAEDYVYATPLPAGWVESIMGMRRTMETRGRTRGSLIHIKLGAGGMADVEFLVQMLQMKEGGKNPLVRGKSVPGFLSLTGVPGLPPSVSTELRSAYLMFREIEKFMRITLEDRNSLLPEGEKLYRLARCMGYAQGDDLAVRVTAAMKRVRQMFLEVASSL